MGGLCEGVGQGAVRVLLAGDNVGRERGRGQGELGGSEQVLFASEVLLQDVEARRHLVAGDRAPDLCDLAVPRVGLKAE